MVCFGAGLSPSEFWDCTIDEAILTYKGKVMDWGVYRVGVLLTVSPHVKEGVNLNSLFKLPFDEEEGGGEMTEEQMQEIYQRALKVNEEFLKKTNG
jgi:hypothetical protein